MAEKHEIEALAERLQAEDREAVVARIRRGECSASMSGIEYYPPWNETPPILKAPYLAKAEAVLG
jgi:hypothetical protein